MDLDAPRDPPARSSLIVQCAEHIGGSYNPHQAFVLDHWQTVQFVLLKQLGCLVQRRIRSHTRWCRGHHVAGFCIGEFTHEQPQVAISPTPTSLPPETTGIERKLPVSNFCLIDESRSAGFAVTGLWVIQSTTTGSRPVGCARIASTGQGAWRNTLSTTLPRNR